MPLEERHKRALDPDRPSEFSHGIDKVWEYDERKRNQAERQAALARLREIEEEDAARSSQGYTPPPMEEEVEPEPEATSEFAGVKSLDTGSPFAKMSAKGLSSGNGNEEEFRQWYGRVAQENGLDPNPDDPRHYYDWRAAHGAGATADKSGHWPSQYKREGHSRLVIDGVDTRTGQKVQQEPAAQPSVFSKLRAKRMWEYEKDPTAIRTEYERIRGGEREESQNQKRKEALDRYSWQLTDKPELTQAMNILVEHDMLDQAEELMTKHTMRKAGLETSASGGGATKARLEAASPELVAKAKAAVEKLRGTGEYNDDYLAFLDTLTDVDPLQALYIVTGKRATTEEGIRKGKEMIPIKTREATAVTTARNMAPEKMSQGQVKDAMSARQVFADLDNAKSLFNEKYAIPYGGKLMKLAHMRRNDDGFATFTTSLALAMNEYRRQNFGTAQTNTEIQNFLDILNTDMEISADAFKAQMNQVLTAMERDYNDKIGILSESQYDVPDRLKNIRMGEGGSRYMTDQEKERRSTNRIRYVRDPKTGSLVRAE